MKKKLLVILMSFVMTATMLPLQAFANITQNSQSDTAPQEEQVNTIEKVATWRMEDTFTADATDISKYAPWQLTPYDDTDLSLTFFGKGSAEMEDGVKRLLVSGPSEGDEASPAQCFKVGVPVSEDTKFKIKNIKFEVSTTLGVGKIWFGTKPGNSFYGCLKDIRWSKTYGEREFDFKIDSGLSPREDFYINMPEVAPNIGITLALKFKSITITYEEGSPPFTYGISCDKPTFGSLESDPATEVEEGKEVTLTYNPPDGDTSKYAKKFNVTGVDGDVTVTKTGENKATFTMPDYDVKASVELGQKYEVTPKTTDHIESISTDYFKTVAPGKEVTILATAEDGYSVTNCHAQDDQGTEYVEKGKTFIMPEKNVTVWADVDKYDIEANDLPAHCTGIKVTAGGSTVTKAAPGTMITATVTTEPGYHVEKVKFLPVSSVNSNKSSAKGEESGLLDDYTYTMETHDVRVVPIIVENLEYTIDITNPKHGTITAAPSGSVKAGIPVVLSYTSDTGYTLAAWDVKDADNNPVQVTNNQFTMPESNVTVTCTEAEPTYKVRTSAQHGTIILSPPQESYAARTKVYLSYSSTTGYEAKTFKVKIGRIFQTVTESFIMPAGDVTVLANETPVQYDITKATLQHGSIKTKVGGVEVDNAQAGTTVSLSYEPAGVGWIAKGWSVVNNETGNPVVIASDNTFTMPVSSVTVSCKEVEAYTVTKKKTDHIDSITTNPNDDNIEPGTQVAISATSEPNYEVTKYHVQDDQGTEYEVSERNTFTMPKKNVTVWADVDKYDIEANDLPAHCTGIKVTAGGSTVTKAAPGTMITATVTTEPGYHVEKVEFLPVSAVNTNDSSAKGEESGLLGDYTYTMETHDVKVLPTIVKSKYTIDITNPEHGTITADPSGPVEADTTVTLICTFDTGYTIDAWNVKDADNNPVAVTDNKFTMPVSNVTITPTEKQIDYTVTTSAQYGKITVTPEKEVYHFDEDIALEYTSDQGYLCRGFKVTKTDGSEVTVDANNHFKMPAGNVTVTANEKEAYAITSKKTDHIVSIKTYLDEDQKTEATSAAEGDTIYLNAESKYGYEVTTYHAKTEDGTELVLQDNMFTMPGKNVTVWADVDQYDIEANASEYEHCTGITVTAGGSPVTKAAPGTIISATATAEKDFKVTDIKFVLVNTSKEANAKCEANGLLNEWTYTMGTGDIKVIPTIEKASEFDITIDESAHGKITTSPAGKAIEGETVTLTYQPTTGWAFNEWEVTKTGTTEKISVDNNTFTMPAGNVTITATETEVYATVTFDSTGGTKVSPQSVQVGQVATKPADPTKEGYTFNGWFVSPVAAGGGFDFENTPITEDITLYADWIENDKPTPVPVPPVNPTDDNGTTNGINTGDNAAAILFAGLGLVATGTVIVLRKRAKNK